MMRVLTVVTIRVEYSIKGAGVVPLMQNAFMVMNIFLHIIIVMMTLTTIMILLGFLSDL